MSSHPRPQLSITLPRNFTFHYSQGGMPKTPDREEVVIRPPSPQAYRIRRRGRPSLPSAGVLNPPHMANDREEIPIPTIEAPTSFEPTLPAVPTIQRNPVETASGYLAPLPSRRWMTAPRTPSARESFPSDWDSSDHKGIGEAIARPMSACSITSNSSEDSNDSSENCYSLGGSCTSPESDAPDPFVFPSVGKGKARSTAPYLQETPTIVRNRPMIRKSIHWTPEMDKHIWTTYMIYLQDPTVTPFKMLPGSPPPLGICHRVARQSRKTWRGGKTAHDEATNTAIPGDNTNRMVAVPRAGSPDTIRPERSGSSTPTLLQKYIPWPKSGSATRKRLRLLCKRKATIAPHYQRLLQSRSPSPFNSSPHTAPHPARVSSPLNEQAIAPSFGTRDIQMSLTTSISSTMQPNGPLAQLSKTAPKDEQLLSDQWFNDPSVPWASPAPIPSDMDHVMDNQDIAAELPRLGSPFGYHTWGPSRTRQRLRPATPRVQSSDVPMSSPRLQSPVQLHGTFPYPSNHKRRAQNQLEDELSPGGTDLKRTVLKELFGDSLQNSHRRVRTRGFSLGDVTIHDRLTSLFSPSDDDEPMTNSEATDLPTMDSSSSGLAPPSQADSIKRLGSPFAGIGSRPSRVRGRHLPSASLSSYVPSAFTSIDQRLGQASFHTSDM